jgi:hypothetical protein
MAPAPSNRVLCSPASNSLITLQGKFQSRQHPSIMDTRMCILAECKLPQTKKKKQKATIKAQVAQQATGELH